MKFNRETASTIGAAKLASGIISSPLAYIDFALPKDYLKFKLELNAFRFSEDVGYPVCAFSFDGGVTFLADTTNFDSYIYGFSSIGTNPTTMHTTRVGGDQSGVDGVLLINVAGVVDASQYGVTSRIEIQPGSSDLLPQIRTLGESGNLFVASPFAINVNLFNGYAAVNQNATVPPTLARANFLRLAQYPTTSFNPPDSGVTIIAGSYVLWGIKL